MTYSIRFDMDFGPPTGVSSGVERFADYEQLRDRADCLVSLATEAHRVSIEVHRSNEDDSGTTKIWSYEINRPNKASKVTP